MHIAITGSKGQLGRELARTLAGNELFLLDLPEVDIQDPQVIQTIIDIKPQIVIHAAALTNVDACEITPERAYQVNAIGTRYVAEAAEQVKAKLIYISTDYVFDGTKRQPYIEEDLPNPINQYGRSKLEGERFAQVYTSKPLILRTAWLYGGGLNNFVSAILRLARERGTVRVFLCLVQPFRSVQRSSVEIDPSPTMDSGGLHATDHPASRSPVDHGVRRNRRSNPMDRGGCSTQPATHRAALFSIRRRQSTACFNGVHGEHRAVRLARPTRVDRICFDCGRGHRSRRPPDGK